MPRAPQGRCLDSRGRYLAIHESTYQLIANVDGADHFFEYERAGTSKPRAHVEVHAHRGALSHLLSRSGHPAPHSMESLHLPVGGERFRPILEDVIEFLIVECRFIAKPHWRQPVAEGRNAGAGCRHGRPSATAPARRPTPYETSGTR